MATTTPFTRPTSSIPTVGSLASGYDKMAQFTAERFPSKPSSIATGGFGKTRGKKLWEYGSRWAHPMFSKFRGLRTGYGVNRPKTLGQYNLGWQSPSARGGGPTTGGLTYGPNIRNPIALDVARSRAMAGRRDPTNILPGEGPGFGPPGRIGSITMAYARARIGLI